MFTRSINRIGCLGRSRRSLSGRHTLGKLTGDQVCNLLAHCNLTEVQHDVRREKLNGAALAVGVDSELDLINVGLKPIYARTLFRYIVGWKINGLPSDFHVDSNAALTLTLSTEEKTKAKLTVCDVVDKFPNKTDRQTSSPVAFSTDEVDVARESSSVCETEEYSQEKKEQMRIDYRYARCADKAALGRIKQAAEAGNHLAEGYLSCCYYLDKDNQVSYAEKALAWVTAEADKGCPVSNYLLGRFLTTGAGVEDNQVEALRRFHLASAAGYVEANTELGECYEVGLGVDIDEELAVRYYAIAADNGCPVAQYRLGRSYLHGRGVEENKKEAKRLLQLSADAGFGDASEYLNELVSI